MGSSGGAAAVGTGQRAIILQAECVMPPDPGVRWSDADQEIAVPEYGKTKTAGLYIRHQV